MDTSKLGNYQMLFNQIKAMEFSKLTIEDVGEFSKDVFKVIKKEVPDTIHTLAIAATTGDQFGDPIDESPMQTVTPVYSVQGGTVIETGYSEDLGEYIVISHANDVKSVYGNCSNVYVQKLERVKKGQIIGEFDYESGKEFSYSLITSK